jgi:hypothetical protein
VELIVAPPPRTVRKEEDGPEMSRTVAATLGTISTVWALGVVVAGSQAAQAQRPQMAEQVFKNVQILKGISVEQFMGTMGFFSASLGLNCTDCHVEASGGLGRIRRRNSPQADGPRDDDHGQQHQ